MNTDNGALEFDAYINNDKLKASIQETENRIGGFTNKVVQETQKIDQAFDITAENIRIQKDVIMQLENELSQLKIDLANMPKGDSNVALAQRIKQVTAELGAEKVALKMLNAEMEIHSKSANKDIYGGATKATSGLNMSLQQVVRELPSASVGLSTFFLAISNNIPILADNIKRARTEEQLLNAEGQKSTPVWKQLVSGLFSWQTAMVVGITLLTLFGKKIQEFFSNLSFGSNKLKLTADDIEEFNTKVSDTAGKQVASIMSLSEEWNKLGDTLREKKRFIQENKDKFNELGISINNVKQAENALVDNKDAFIESVKMKARAAASMDLAAEQYKKAIKKMQEAEAMPDKVKQLVTTAGGTTGVGTASWQLVTNADKALAKKSADEIMKLGDSLINQQVSYEKKSDEILKDAGIKKYSKLDDIKKTYEQHINDIKKLYESYNDAVAIGETKVANEIKRKLPSGFNTYEDYIKNELQKAKKSNDVQKLLILTPILAQIKTDKFEESLKRNKELYQEYYKYISIYGEDAAKKQFGNLGSYSDFIKSKIEQVKKEIGTGTATKEQVKQLIDLNDELKSLNATEDQFSQFKNSLSSLKEESKTTIDYLQKLNEERAKVTGGKTNLTPEQKTQAISLIDKESSDASAKALNDLMNKYQNTQAKMLSAQKQYTSDSEMLTAKLVSAQIAGDEKGVKSAQDALTQRKTDFEKEMSNISVTDLMKSPDWTKLFSNLDNLTVSELLKLKEKIEGQFKNLNLSPEDMKTVRDKINEVTGQIEKRNPFMALSDSIKNYSKDASSVNLKAVFKDVSGSIDLVKGAFDEVVGTLDKMGVKLDEGDKQVLSDISGIVGGASQLAQGIATGNPLAIVQGTISVISNGIDLIAGAKDRKLERSIQKHAEAVKQLKADYEQLERAVDKALGTAVYDNQKASIENLKKQRQEYQAMMADEQSKKKSDSGKIDEYKSAITDINNQISDMLDSIKEELLGTDLKSIVKDLGSSIIDAFSSGEDAATAWGNKVNDIVGSIVKNLLLQKMEAPIGNIINSYLSKWVGSDGTLLMSTDNIINQATQMGAELKSFGDNMDAILKALPDNVKKYLTDSSSSSSSSSSSLSGSVQSVTEQTADVISGQMNAIRINQIESLNTLRNQLIALNMIANNTTIHLTKLDAIISALSNISNSNTRASGLF